MPKQIKDINKFKGLLAEFILHYYCREFDSSNKKRTYQEVCFIGEAVDNIVDQMEEERDENNSRG